MTIRLLVIILLLITGLSKTSTAQILFTESFSVILDSTKNVKGSIVPGFKFQTQKKNLIEFENNADITIKIKKNAVTFANKIELSKFGKETLLSGGYVYAEFRQIFEKKWSLEPYSQIQWAEARGINLKFAIGCNGRYRIIQKQKIGLFAGMGPFYEFERWTYKGVSDSSLIPLNVIQVEQNNIKLGTYLSLKYKPVKSIFLDLSLYHQSRFDQIFSSPRLASSSRITYNFTEHLGLTLIYQNIYDFAPVVPIRKFYSRIVFSISVSF